MSRVVCVGGVVIDEVFAVDRLPCGGGKTFLRDGRTGGGGIAATAACAIAALGGEALWVGPVGADDNGRLALGLMETCGVDCRGAQVRTGIPTPVATALIDPQGERHLIVRRHPALDIEPRPLPPADAVLADHRHLAGSLAALREGRSRAIPTVLDADNGAPEHVAALVTEADHVVFALGALQGLTGEAEPAAGLAATARRLDGAAGTVLAVTLGQEGSLFLIGGDLNHVGAPRVTPSDTTGCGDVFHGAYALAIAEGRAVLEAARFASAAAALKAEAGRGWDGLAGRDAVEGLMKETW